MKTGGIILAGGTGKRFGGLIPKQFLKLGDRIILQYSIDKFLPVVDSIVVVSHPDWIKTTESLLPSAKNISVVAGGETRQLSVRNGLEALSSQSISIVAIHDGARPLFSVELLRLSIETAAKSGSAIPVLPVASTLAKVDGHQIVDFVDRASLYQIQTPQTFQFNLIWQAHQIAGENQSFQYTDDSQLLEILHRKADTIKGEERNIKITQMADLDLALFLLSTNKNS